MLIGEVKEPKDSDIDQIFQSFKESFENFKDKMEVRDILTRVEELKEEGRSEVLPLIAEQDKQLAEQAEQLAEQTEQLAELAEQIRKLEAQIDGNLS